MIENINKPPVRVKHKELERADSESMFRSICPVCEKGYLLVGRSLVNFELEEHDNCICCGQRFIYEDIAEMRKRERA